MSEYKPKQDDRMASGGKPKKSPQPSRETKPHGDKLQVALDAISDAISDEPRRNKKPH